MTWQPEHSVHRLGPGCGKLGVIAASAKAMTVLLSGILLVGCATPGSTAQPQPPAATDTPSPTRGEINLPATWTPTPITPTAVGRPATPVHRPSPTPTATPELGQPLPRLSPSDGLHLFRLSMMDARVGWAGTLWSDQYIPADTYHLLRTEDGGRTWREVTPPQIAPPSAVRSWTIQPFFQDALHAFAVFHADQRTPGQVWRTSDGGRTWRASAFMPRGNMNESASFMRFPEPQVGWLLNRYFLGASSYAQAIQRTHDGGQTWESVIPLAYGPYPPVLDLGALSATVAWVTAGSGPGFNPPYELDRTRDGGLHWSAVELGEAYYPVDGYDDCSLESPVPASYEAGRIVRVCSSYQKPTRVFIGYTSNGGRSFQYFEAPGLPDFVGEKDGWALAGPEPGTPSAGPYPLYRTDDGGRTWQRIGQLDGDYRLDFADTEHGWASDDQTLLTTVDSGKTWSALDPALVDSAPPRDQTNWVDIPTQLLDLQPSDIGRIGLLAELGAPHATDLAANSSVIWAALQGGRLAEWDWRFSNHIPRDLPQVRVADDWIYKVDSLPDDIGFVAACRDGNAYRSDEYETPTLGVLPGSSGEISGVAQYSDGVLTSGEDGQVRFWVEPSDSERPWSARRAMDAHQGWVWDVAVSPDESLFATAGSDGTVRLWSLDSAGPMGVLRGHTSAVTRVAFSPDGKLLASASRDGTVRLWHVANRESAGVLRGHHDWVVDLAFSPAGDLLASAGADGQVIVWNPQSGEMLKQLSAHVGGARGVVFRPDGKMLVTVGDDQKLRLWGIER